MSLDYNTNVRRIGSVRFTDALLPLVIEFNQYGVGAERTYLDEGAEGANSTTLVSGGASSGAWTAVDASVCAPPTAKCLLLDLMVISPAGTQILYVRPRNRGSATATRNRRSSARQTDGTRDQNEVECLCDGAQFIDFASTSATLATNVYFDGYKEEL